VYLAHTQRLLLLQDLCPRAHISSAPILVGYLPSYQFLSLAESSFFIVRNASVIFSPPGRFGMSKNRWNEVNSPPKTDLWWLDASSFCLF
jgi:hypothetical protein